MFLKQLHKNHAKAVPPLEILDPSKTEFWMETQILFTPNHNVLELVIAKSASVHTQPPTEIEILQKQNPTLKDWDIMINCSPGRISGGGGMYSR